MVYTDIVIKPVLSEKSLREASVGRYTFLVTEDSNKNQIRQALHELFKVDVVTITTSTKTTGRASSVRARRRVASSIPGKKVKKARVTLKKDQKIEFFDEMLKKK